MACDKMKAFSNSAHRSVSCDIIGDEGKKTLGLGGQDQSRLLSASITPGEECVTLAPCSPKSGGGRSDLSTGTIWGLNRENDGSERRLESNILPAAPAASASSNVTPNRSNSEAEFDEDGASNDTDGQSGSDSLVGGLVAPHETVLMTLQGLSEVVIENVEEDEVAAADWLDVSHALLDVGTEAGEASSG